MHAEKCRNHGGLPQNSPAFAETATHRQADLNAVISQMNAGNTEITEGTFGAILISAILCGVFPPRLCEKNLQEPIYLLTYLVT